MKSYEARGSELAFKCRALTPSSDTTRLSAARTGCSWPWPTSTQTTEVAPSWSTQSVKPPVEAPTSNTVAPRRSSWNASTALASFPPARETNRSVGGQLISSFAPAETAVDGLQTTTPSTLTSPAWMADFACARAAHRPWLTRRESSRTDAILGHPRWRSGQRATWAEAITPGRCLMTSRPATDGTEQKQRRTTGARMKVDTALFRKMWADDRETDHFKLKSPLSCKIPG